MEYWIMLLYIVISALGIHYLYQKFFNLFKRHDVIHVPPESIPRIIASLTFRRIHFTDLFHKIYHFKSDTKYIGFYSIADPIVLVRDPELIKEMFVKNFETFSNRRGFGEVNDPLFSKNLFSLKGQKWRDVRTLLSPAFTSSKMKIMYSLMSECAVDFGQFLSNVTADKADMDMKDAFAKFTTDVIATCAFGIKVDSMRNPTNKFYIYGKDATTFTGLPIYKFILITNFPKLAKLLGIKMMKNHVEEFFKDIIKSTISIRDSKNITRPDMIQLMMDMRGKRETGRELDIVDMTAQAFIFFFGGFETNSTAMSFIAHEIAANPDIQEKLRQEIDEVLNESNGEVTYEAINRLEYLDAVINESLRMYPPVAFIERICEGNYELPPALPGEKSFTIKKGQIIWAPAFSIHHDENYYPDPEKFRPERFLGKNAYHNPSCYLPFGIGPRMCIANRFALLEIKVLMFHLLARCELKPCAKTTLPMKYDKKNLFLSPEGGFWLNVQRRSDMHPTLRSDMSNNGVTNF